MVALTPNAEVNVLVAQRAREAWLVPDLYALPPSAHDGGLFSVLDDLGGHVAVARPADPSEWDERIRAGATRDATIAGGAALPLALLRGDGARPFGGGIEPGDRVVLLEPGA